MKINNDNKGSVTVFLCMISGVMLLLIICLIGIMRYRWEETQLVRCANIAVRSELGKYYRPLYDTYRMFYYVDAVPDRFDAGVAGYFLDNQKNMPDFLRLTLSHVDVSEKLYAINEGGINVRKQMCSGIKYMLGEKAYEQAVKQFRKKEEELNDNGLNESVNEELQKVESELDSVKEKAKLESEVLELLRLVEGISVVEGKVMCHQEFVKEGIPGEITSSNAGVDCNEVWKKTKSKYWSIDALPKLLNSKSEKAIAGENESIPVDDFGSWSNKIEKLLQTTEKAYEIANSITLSAEFGNVGAICDVGLFKKLLCNNKSVLQEVLRLAGNAKTYSAVEYQNWFDISREIIDVLDNYHVNELIFDYSTLKQEEVRDPRENAAKMVGGIVGLLVENRENISKKVITESDIYAKLMEADNETVQNEDYFFGEDAEELQEFLGECKDNTESKWDEIGVRLYVNSFFDNYVNKKSGIIKSLPEKALDYELEYIIAGKETDEQNLKAVINSILLQRTGVSFISLLSDKVNSNKAYAVAAALVGFTGVDALVRCVQLSIIGAWAYEDACVDMAILLAGKKLPLIKQKLNVTFEEMLLFNREFIQKKAAQAAKEGVLDYEALLNTLLITKGKKLITGRTMDIIQNNMKLNYSRKFSFQNCMYGATSVIGCSKPYELSTGVKYEYD